jgi:cytochrome c5
LALRPADPRIASLYETACKACHAVAGTGAPLVADHAAWDPRWKQGLPVLLDHVLQGYRGMPAGGQCLTCTPQDHQALIRFLADQPEPKS